MNMQGTKIQICLFSEILKAEHLCYYYKKMQKGNFFPREREGKSFLFSSLVVYGAGIE